jgi:hypothetical protein
MTLADRYRTKAVDCHLRAESAEDAQHRTLFLHMEECWNALAARADVVADGLEEESGGIKP